MRTDGRKDDELRQVVITPGYLSFAEGSALIEMGKTRVLCAVSLDEKVPQFLMGQGKGWVTAEYAMLPRSTPVRVPRDMTGRGAGRAMEIQRLVGRCLRAVTDLKALGERTVLVDCDVIQADGGTRTAAITGAYVALYQALWRLVQVRVLTSLPLTGAVAAVSVGIVDNRELVDLCYEEDSRAQVDMNIAMTDKDQLVEVQATAEGAPFSPNTLQSLLTLAQKGIHQLHDAQKQAIERLSRSS